MGIVYTIGDFENYLDNIKLDNVTFISSGVIEVFYDNESKGISNISFSSWNKKYTYEREFINDIDKIILNNIENNLQCIDNKFIHMYLNIKNILKYSSIFVEIHKLKDNYYICSISNAMMSMRIFLCDQISSLSTFLLEIEKFGEL